MKDLERIITSINNLRHDIKAEAIIGDILEYGLELNDIVAVQEGLFKRRFKPDVTRADIKTLNNFINELSKNRKVLLVGHSMGGGIATRCAIDNQKSLKGLILVGSSLDPELEKILPIQRIAEKPPLKWLLSRSVYNSNHELLQYREFLENLKTDLTRYNAQ